MLLLKSLQVSDRYPDFAGMNVVGPEPRCELPMLESCWLGRKGATKALVGEMNSFYSLGADTNKHAYRLPGQKQFQETRCVLAKSCIALA